MLKKQEKAPDEFWREYEEQTGEKVLERRLGKYICGWDKFDEKKWGGIWGLLITTSGGFRFHHFPQNSWIDNLTNFAWKNPPKEKTLFISQEKIKKLEVIKETKWWKKVFNSSPPMLVIRYLDESGSEKRLVFEADYGKADYSKAD